MAVHEVSRSVACIASATAFLTVMAAAGAPSVLLRDYQRHWDFSDTALTVAFAVYSLVLLATLLICGGLSDHLGRRPVAVGALVLSAATMVLFLTADSIAVLIIARAAQGAATGAATTVFSASIVELAKPRARHAAEIMVSITTAGGLGIGITLAGIAEQLSAWPAAPVFATALTIILATGLIVAISPETVSPEAGVIKSLVPRVRAPFSIRRQFGRLAPGLAGIWMSAGLVLGLGASLATTIMDLGQGVVAAIVVATQPLTATISMIVLAPRLPPHCLVPAGLVTVSIGVGIEGTSFMTGNGSLLIIGAVITGIGFGAVFSGILRELLPHIGRDERSEFFAIFYVVGYLAYGVSAIVAGILSDVIGLRAAAAIYAIATIIVIGVALVFLVGRGRAVRSPSPRK